MLMNFCDPCLLSEAKCNTASNEGNDVVNLVNGSDKGFLAYYAVRPPVHIDFKFVCKIQLSHIVIWPCVNSQKSSGLKLSAKAYPTAPDYKEVLAVFLKPAEPGVFLYRNDFDYSTIAKPPNFVERYMQFVKFPTINATNELRISIIKTDNSVPAIQRIEVWGRVSHVCDVSTKTTLETLWNRRYNNTQSSISSESIKEKKNEGRSDGNINEEVLTNRKLLDVPEDFLDPITCEIMIRPVVLPSGNIIDQSTLERHEKSETAWGRALSDPFTGLPFNHERVVIPAVSLKQRIDKFLLQNSNYEEIKNMPRVLGSKQRRSIFSTEVVKPRPEIATTSRKDTKRRKCETTENSLQKSHRLPFSALQKSSTSLVPKNVNKVADSGSVVNESRKLHNKEAVICDCCVDKILYKLPCKHVICRRVLLLGTEQCSVCNVLYKRSDPVRIYL